MQNNIIDETDTLLLWSWQTPGFCLTKGTIDHSLSEFERTPGYRKSRKELFDRLGDDQYIWCLTRVGKIWQNRVKWELKVPKHRVRLICSITWHWIIHRNAGDSIECTLPEEFFEFSGLPRNDFYKRFHDYWRNKTTEELWNALFLDEVQTRTSAFLPPCTDALIPYPVEKDWVIKHI